MSLDRISKEIVNLIIKSPKRILLVFLIINLLLIPGIFNLVSNVEPSLEKVLPNDVSEIQTMNYLRSEFGVDMVYLVVHTTDSLSDVRDPKFIDYVDILSQRIETLDNVLEVRSISNHIKDVNFGEIPLRIEDLEKLTSTDDFAQYVSWDYSFAVIGVRTNTGSSASLVSNLIDSINYEIDLSLDYNPGATIEITGFSAIDKATFSVIMSDFLVITFVSMAAIAIIVFIAFKSLTKGMLPMIIVMNALVWTMGIVGYLDLTITVVSMVSAAMIMGLGIDFGIHQVHSYFDYRKKLSPKDSLFSLMEELLRAMLGASMTTIAGFMALLFGVLPAMKTLGIILSLGILTTLIGAIFLLPTIIYLYDNSITNKNKIKKLKN